MELSIQRDKLLLPTVQLILVVETFLLRLLFYQLDVIV